MVGTQKAKRLHNIQGTRFGFRRTNCISVPHRSFLDKLARSYSLPLSFRILFWLINWELNCSRGRSQYFTRIDTKDVQKKTKNNKAVWFSPVDGKQLPPPMKTSYWHKWDITPMAGYMFARPHPLTYANILWSNIFLVFNSQNNWLLDWLTDYQLKLLLFESLCSGINGKWYPNGVKYDTFLQMLKQDLFLLVSGVNNHGRRRLQKHSQCLKLPISTVRIIINKAR